MLIAPDGFTGTLTAAEAATAMAEGWHRWAPQDELDVCPLSDGGPGFIEALHAALGGRFHRLQVTGPLGVPVPADLLLVPRLEAEASGRGPELTAFLESAQACGLHLVPTDRRDPGVTTTVGVGELLLAARRAGATRIVIGLGGSGTNDAGAGMLAALGATAAGDPQLAPLLDRLRSGGAGLRALPADGLAPLRLDRLRAHWAQVQLVAATDVVSPLLGPDGASAVFAAQKGADPDRIDQLERALSDFAAAVTGCGLPADLAARAGAGAAGGLGFGLLLLGARRTSGVAAVLDAVRFADRLPGCDLVLTGEGTLDWQSLQGKVVAGVAEAAQARGVPVVAVAGQIRLGRRDLRAAGLAAGYPVAEGPQELADALADPAGTLAARTEQAARAWSR